MAHSDALISIVQFDGGGLTHLSVVRGDAGFEIVARASERVDGAPDSAALRDFADRCGVARDSLYTVLPRHQVTLRILTLPARDPDEIASMVALSAGEFVPFPRASLLVRHQVIEERPNGESRVLLLLLHRDVLDRHLALLAGAGLEPREIFLSTTCLQTAATAAPGAPAGRFGVIHLTAAGLEIVVLEDGVLQFSRGIAHAAPWDLDDPHSRESLVYELRDALSAYRRECEDGLGVEMLFVASEDRPVAPFAAVLEEAIGKPCFPADFATDIMAGGSADTEDLPLVGLGAALAAAGRAPQAMGLVPPSLARNRALRGMRRKAVRAAALAGVVLLALGGWFMQAVVQRTLLIRELEERAALLAPSAEGIAAKQARLQLISRQVDPDGGFLPLLAAVAEAAPEEGLNVTRIAYDRNTGLDLWGRALSRDLVLTKFLGSLRGLGEGGLNMLARAHSQYETAGKERDRVVVNYHIAVPILEEEDPDVAAAPTP